MRTLKNVFVAVSLLCALSAPSIPAFAISKVKWTSACDKGLGIRSGATANDTDGAGYGLDDGKAGFACFQAPPGNWDTRLADTIAFMRSFENGDGRYLIIMKICRGSAGRYWDNRTFPKCPTSGQTIIAATAQTMVNYSNQELAEWVINNIP